MYGIRSALGHESRTIGYPDTTVLVPTQSRYSVDGQHHILRTVSLNRMGQVALLWDTTSKKAMVYTGGTSRSEHRSAQLPPRTPKTKFLLPRLHRGSHNQGPCVVGRAASTHHLWSRHITGCGSAQYPRELMAVVYVMKQRPRYCMMFIHSCARMHICVRHRSARSGFIWDTVQ